MGYIYAVIRDVILYLLFSQWSLIFYILPVNFCMFLPFENIWLEFAPLLPELNVDLGLSLSDWGVTRVADIKQKKLFWVVSKCMLGSWPWNNLKLLAYCSDILVLPQVFCWFSPCFLLKEKCLWSILRKVFLNFASLITCKILSDTCFSGFSCSEETATALLSHICDRYDNKWKANHFNRKHGTTKKERTAIWKDC